MQSSHPISTESEHLSVADRIESFKAGFLGAIASVFAFFAIALLHHFLQNFLSVQLISSFELSNPFILLIKLGIIGFSGFLFAVTYRYIVRRDRNSHLKSGAILAFACIRSFGAIDHDLPTLTLLPLVQLALVSAILLLENVAWLAIVQSLLETAIQYKWIAAFGSAKD
ncbi:MULTISPECIES: hypothetical protein [Pseudanabaena]|uniref:hypothetical protein n=1 Tax=Pseudanabaena TaxID=1152 RepID=UPI002478C21E|nr:MULTISPECIES: hypothetical protein [Pseudanabaena]MEA5486244.1 hypothetical protein [Pseudanabaena sp. CCNP1317]WGS70616.1 hypothetical protein OA858_12855 [Pseudanabaena galeata CCNP1313]